MRKVQRKREGDELEEQTSEGANNEENERGKGRGEEVT